MDILKQRKNCLIVGRGSTGIYLALSRFKNEKVLLPANICYAAIYPVLYSGNNPVFCDVDRITGNVRLSDVSKMIDGVSAAVIPHMYGNPVQDILAIKELCHKHNVLLIEDCASSMGACVLQGTTGSFGDYVIYSTGYSKTLDIGNGGFLLSDNALLREQELNADLPLYDSNAQKLAMAFSREYRIFRNSKKDIRECDFRTLVQSDMRNAFLYRNSDSFNNYIVNCINDLDRIIIQRRKNVAYYDERIAFDSEKIDRYSFSTASVPWRYNLFVHPAIRDALVDQLLTDRVPVSDWYPVSSNLFSDYGEYEGAYFHGERILNFPLMIEKTEIDRICKSINKAINCLSL